MEIAGTTFLRVEDGKCSLVRIQNERKGLAAAEPSVKTVERFPIVFDYQGSILSQLKESQLNPLLQELKEAIANIRSLDLLSPELLRSRTKSAEGTLGLGGNRLSAFIHESGKPVQEKLNRSLKEVYVQLDRVETKSLRSGWKQLEITEDFGGHKLKTSARHMNDGMLRLLAVFAQLEAGSEFLLFDEIENGINPELIEFLIDHLVQSNHQVVVTTHSPMILNFLEADIARKGVVYLYKNRQGYTKAKRFFEIPSLSEKLEFMGPGEAFVDTDLKALAAEIATLNLIASDQ